MDTLQTNERHESYLYNPKDPVPTYGGNNFLLSPCGPWNQNHVERGRKDVIQFTSENITETFAIVGPISVNLFVGSDAVDTDFTANVVDVFPDGMLLAEAMIAFKVKFTSKFLVFRCVIYRPKDVDSKWDI